MPRQCNPKVAGRALLGYARPATDIQTGDAMLEIFLLIFLGKRLAAKARSRGYAGWPWVVLLVPGWFGSLFVGVVVASIAYLATHPNEEGAPMLLLIPAAYAVAGCVAAGLFLVVGLLPDRRPDDQDDEEYDERPRRRVKPAADDPYGDDERRYKDEDDGRRR